MSFYVAGWVITYCSSSFFMQSLLRAKMLTISILMLFNFFITVDIILFVDNVLCTFCAEQEGPIGPNLVGSPLGQETFEGTDI